MPSPTSTPDPVGTDDALRAAAHALGPTALWVADVIPLFRRSAADSLETTDPTPVPPTPDAPSATIRHAFVLVTAESLQLHADLLNNPIADHAAQYIADAVRAAVDATGVVPTTLAIRGYSVASDVHRLLTHSGDPRFDDLTVTPIDAIADVDGTPGDTFAATSLRIRRAMDGDDLPHAPSAALLRWSHWGVPLPDVAAFFHAAAALYRAADARGFSGDGEGTIFVLDTPGTGEALATVTGTSSRPRGCPETVTIYTEPNDWGALIASAGTDPRAASVDHPAMSLHYFPATELELDAVQEIREHGWEIAAPTAYPWVWLLNPIGGGLTTSYLRTLTAQLGALARALASDRDGGVLDVDLSLHHIDRETGIDVHTIAA